MGNLSENFSKSEFACPHCGLSNPNPVLIDALQDFRDLLGVSVYVSSAGRCPSTNEPNPAQHWVSITRQSNAADCIVPRAPLLALYGAALEIPAFMAGGIGIYPKTKSANEGFLHLDVRNFFARWARIKGKYITHQAGLDWIFAQLKPTNPGMVMLEIPQGKTSYNVPVPGYWS